MALYLLDTNILIDLTGARASARFFEPLLEEPNLQLGTSILCLAEFVVGASPREAALMRQWYTEGDLQILYLDGTEDALRAGLLRKTHRLALPDAFIVASAERHRAHLLTHDSSLLTVARTLIAATDPFI